ncbi:MAG: radical SAM protein [Candidatus Gastranaerophilales bacterium]|nr:radical SAM protein [Candidatus Gastranaerophilales bacterium]
MKKADLLNFINTDEYKQNIYKSKEELPKKIRLEASTVCQLQCPQCYMVRNKEKVKTTGCKNGFLKFENFKKLVDEYTFEEIELSNSGEIFLNPDLVKIIEYGYKKGIVLTAQNGVNLNNLSEEQAEALVKYHFDSITVSIDGASPEVYKKYRVNGDFNQVINNIKKIQKYQEKYKSNYPLIEWKFIIFGHNEHEIEKAKQMAKELGVEIVFERQWDDSFSPVKNERAAVEATGTVWDRTSFKEQIDEFENGNIPYFDCLFIWEQPQINHDGRILGCCTLYWGDFSMEGYNVFEDGFLKAMNSPKLVYAKNMLMNKVPAAEDIPCSKCWVYQDLCSYPKWPFNPLKDQNLSQE